MAKPPQGFFTPLPPADSTGGWDLGVCSGGPDIQAAMLAPGEGDHPDHAAGEGPDSNADEQLATVAVLLVHAIHFARQGGQQDQ